ncbi:hypothetical protein BN903_107 [Halorubrum sp. AJ67]|nr:hypothetical protein BN903_107 [Halorubrum sp. AJ67]
MELNTEFHQRFGVASRSTNTKLVSSKQPLKRSFSGIYNFENIPPHFSNLIRTPPPLSF